MLRNQPNFFVRFTSPGQFQIVLMDVLALGLKMATVTRLAIIQLVIGMEAIVLVG